MRRQDLERLTREQLIAEAEKYGVPRPRVLTQPELIDEIIQRTATSEGERRKARGWLGRARDLLARVVERGLHLPEAARMLRTVDERGWPAPPPPLPTVTLAEIYAAQGHLERALGVLDEVIDRDPSHRDARALRAKLTEQLLKTRGAKRTEAADPKVDEPVQEPLHEAPPTRPSAPDPIEVAQVAETPAEEPKAEDPPKASEVPLVLEEAFAAKAPEPPEAWEIEETLVAPPKGKSSPSEEVNAPEPPEAWEIEETLVAAQKVPAAVEPLKEGEAEEPLAAGEVKAPVEAAGAALPARYDVDEIVAIAVDPFTLYLYWEVRPLTFAKAQAERPEGRLVVRVASITPSWDKPFVETADLPVDALYGDRFLRDVRPGSNLRISVGWLSGGELLPFAVGDEVSSPRAEPMALMAREAEERGEISAPGAKTVEARPGAAPLHVPFLVAVPDDASFSVRVEAATARRPVAIATPVDTGVARFERAFAGPEAQGPLGEGGAPPPLSASANRSARVIQHLAEMRVQRSMLGGASELGFEELGGASDWSYEELGGASDLV